MELGAGNHGPILADCERQGRDGLCMFENAWQDLAFAVLLGAHM